MSIQTFLVSSLNFDFKASVLNFVWMDFAKVPRKCIRCCVAVNGGFMTFEFVVSREPTFPVIARCDVDLLSDLV